MDRTAQKKWDSKHLKRLTLTLSFQDYMAYRSYCKFYNVSQNKMLKALLYYMLHDKTFIYKMLDDYDEFISYKN